MIIICVWLHGPPRTFSLNYPQLIYLHTVCSGIHQDKRSPNKFSLHNKLSIARRQAAWKPVSPVRWLPKSRSKAKSVHTRRTSLLLKKKRKHLRGSDLVGKVKMALVILLQRFEGTSSHREDRMGGVSRMWECQRRKRSRRKWDNWEIFEATQCLLSVHLISIVHVRLQKDSIVLISREGLLCVCGGGGGGYSLVARPTLWSIAGSQPINVRPHWPRLPVQHSGSQSYTFEFHVFPRGRTTSIPILSRWLWRISMESGIKLKWISFNKWISKCYMCFSWAVYR